MFLHNAQFNYYRIKLLNQFYGHIKVSIYIYAILKHVSRKTSTFNTATLKLFAFILSPIIFTTIWLLRIIKSLIAAWIAYTDQGYVSMLDGTETVFIAQESKKSRAVITTLFLLENQAELSGKDFHAFCTDNITSIFRREKFLKLQCSVRYKLGYFYFKNEQWPMKTFFKPFDCENLDGNMNHLSANETKSTLSLEQLRVYISKVHNLEMPQNGESLWEARIGKQKVAGTNCYPLVLRFHHIFGDAVTLFNMFTVDFQQNVKQSMKHNIPSEVRSLGANYMHNPFITITGTDTADLNVMCQTSGDKHVVWLTETKPQIINTIKEIKQKQRNATTVDVMLTCLLESLAGYFTKLNVPLPENVYTALPMMPPKAKYTPYGRVTNYAMNNKISLAFLRLPLKIRAKSREDALLQRLELIKHEYNVFKNVSLDFWCNRWQGTVILTLLPWAIQEWFVRKYRISLMVSNIPGCQNLEFFGRCKVKEFVVIDPNTSISGVSLMITSYEDRLNFGYTIDQSVIPNVEDVKKISTDFIDNLHKLKQLTA